jgi:hypothetical protein
VVVACADHTDSLERCIASISAACSGIETEIIVVGSVGDGRAIDAVKQKHRVRVISMPGRTLVPRLWSEGIAASAGSVVALTISQCCPGPDWARSLLSAISNGAAAAGGPLTLSSRASVFDSAIFFLRYSAFLSHRTPSTTAQIAGDNCAYSSEALEIGGWTRDGGFWEVEVNRLLIGHGEKVAWVPDAKMEFSDAGDITSNTRRRFIHGKHFGASRKVDHGESSLRIALVSPLVPFVLFARAAKRAWPVKRYRLPLMTSVPAFALLSASWAIGEAVGAVGGRIANRS